MKLIPLANHAGHPVKNVQALTFVGSVTLACTYSSIQVMAIAYAILKEDGNKTLRIQ